MHLFALKPALFGSGSVASMDPPADAYGDEGAEKPALVQTHIDSHFKSAKPAKCPHGRQRTRCKDCGGSEICPHGRSAVSAARTDASSIAARSAVLLPRGSALMDDRKARVVTAAAQEYARTAE